MNLMKFSIPLTLYRLEPSTLANVTGDAIRRFAFRSIDNTPVKKHLAEMTRAPPRGKARRSFPDPERRNSKTFASPGSFQKQNTAPL